jgi:hypothetical protein
MSYIISKTLFHIPYDNLPEFWARNGEHGRGGGRDGKDGEGNEPEPLDEEDLVVDDVEAEDAHGVVHVQVARQSARRKLATEITVDRKSCMKTGKLFA